MREEESELTCPFLLFRLSLALDNFMILFYNIPKTSNYPKNVEVEEGNNLRCSHLLVVGEQGGVEV